MKTPILETSRLWLKPLKEEDAPGAFLWTGDPKVSWYMRYETHGSLEDTKQWLREEEKQLDPICCMILDFIKRTATS